VAGRGIEALKRQGISVTVGGLEAACREINESFFKFIQSRVPFVTLKCAQTLDGRIATLTGHSRWISSLPSRRFSHRLSHAHDAVLVGIGTVMYDDPELTVRLVQGKNPLRIVVDSHLRTPLTARILKDQDQARTLMVTSNRAEQEKLHSVRELGIETLIIPETSPGRIDLAYLLQDLGKRNIASVLIEGGAGIITSVIAQGLADRLIAIVAPKIAGQGIEAVGQLNITEMDKAIGLVFEKISRKGDDLVIDSRFLRPL